MNNPVYDHSVLCYPSFRKNKLCGLKILAPSAYSRRIYTYKTVGTGKVRGV